MLGRFKSAANAFYSAINLDGTGEGSSAGDAIPGVGGVHTTNGHSAAAGASSEGSSGGPPPSTSGSSRARVKYAYQRPICLQLFADEEIQVHEISSVPPPLVFGTHGTYRLPPKNIE